MSMPFAYPNTDRCTLLALYIIDLIEASKGNFDTPIQEVFYGRHNMVPRSPTVVVMSGLGDFTLQGVAAPGGRKKNELSIIVDVLAADVLEGESAGRLKTDTLAEDVQRFLEANTTMGGLIIHGYVHRRDPGEVFINGSMWRQVRLTFVGESRTYLSPPAAPV